LARRQGRGGGQCRADEKRLLAKGPFLSARAFARWIVGHDEREQPASGPEQWRPESAFVGVTP
jgi:hypothetical protein